MVRSDEDIKKIIVEELTHDKRIDASKIKVEVKNSKVTLSGEVPSAVAQSSANWITTAIPEVTDVINNFTVRRPATLTMAADEKKAAGGNKNTKHCASTQ
jgi:osmotically-inducible protein OsmY